MSTAADQRFDLAIIGGGITGAGIARDAALRGLRVVLLEKDDFGSGTSSKSSKLVHGGLRYLEHGELALVFESVSERQVQTSVAPHLVRPQPFLIPIYAGNKPGFEIVNIGLWIYDALAMFRAPALHRTFRGAKAGLRLEPKLRADGLRGVLEYHDCATDDARLVLENILDARALGAECHNHSEVVAIRHVDGRASEIEVRDRFTGGARTIHANAVVLAAGAWTDESRRRLGILGPRDVAGSVSRDLLRRTKGVHIVVPRERLPLDRAITLISPIDGRVMFAIPWRERTVLGTTDTDFTGTADDVAAEREDVEYLIASGNGYFPGAGLTTRDVIATWAGLRPLIAPPQQAAGEDESDVSREHEVFVQDDGIIIIAGGKLTTYRLMARQTVEAAVQFLVDHGQADRSLLHADPTKGRPLPGAAGLPTSDLQGVATIGHRLMDAYGLDGDRATHLCGVYGVRAPIIADAIRAAPEAGQRIVADLPYLWAEIDFAVRHDLARTVCDVLARRVPMLLVDREQGVGVAPKVMERMARLLGWDAQTRGKMLSEYLHEVNLSRRWKVSPASQRRAALVSGGT